eukprot:6189526-Pleurochrysis_carterae.AAC.1
MANRNALYRKTIKHDCQLHGLLGKKSNVREHQRVLAVGLDKVDDDVAHAQAGNRSVGVHLDTQFIAKSTQRSSPDWMGRDWF